MCAIPPNTKLKPTNRREIRHLFSTHTHTSKMLGETRPISTHTHRTHNRNRPRRRKSRQVRNTNFSIVNSPPAIGFRHSARTSVVGNYLAAAFGDVESHCSARIGGHNELNWSVHFLGTSTQHNENFTFN